MAKKIQITESQLQYIVKNINRLDEQGGQMTGQRAPKNNKSGKNPYVWGNKRKGSLNFSAVGGKYGYMMNNGLFKEDNKSQMYIISSTSTAPRLIGGEGDEGDVEPSVANIKINFSIDDPFNFDQVTLTSDGESGYKRFIKEYNDSKKVNGKVWNDYLSFIKKQGGITILGYASQDGDPNEADGGGLQACSANGVGKGPKNQYNLCLSQQRADTIRDKIINDIPELTGLLTARGMGETCDFGPCWSKDNNVTSTDTAPNRKFMVNFPEYNDSSKTTTKTAVKSKTSADGEVNWASVTTFIDLSGYGIKGKYKAVKGNRGVKLEPGKVKELRKLLGNKIPVVGAVTINNSKVGDGVIGKNGIKVTSGDGTTSFLNWKNPSDIVRGGSAEINLFKQTDWSLAVSDSGLELFNLAITLTKYSKTSNPFVNQQ